MENKLKTYRTMLENGNTEAIPRQRRAYLDYAMKEYKVVLKQYNSWDKREEEEVPDIKTDLPNYEDAY